MALDSASLSNAVSLLPLTPAAEAVLAESIIQGGDGASPQPVFEVSAAAASALQLVKAESESESGSESLSQVMSRLAQQVYDEEFAATIGPAPAPVMAEVTAPKTTGIQIASAAILTVPTLEQVAPAVIVRGATVAVSVSVDSHDDASLLPRNWIVDRRAEPTLADSAQRVESASASETRIGFTSPIPSQPFEISGAARTVPLDSAVASAFVQPQPSAPFAIFGPETTSGSAQAEAETASLVGSNDEKVSDAALSSPKALPNGVPIAMSWPVRLTHPSAASKAGGTVIRTAGFTSAIPAQPFEASGVVRAGSSFASEAQTLVAPTQALAFSVFRSERPATDSQLADLTADPILSLSQGKATASGLRDVVGLAVARHPAMGEAIAGAEEANAARSEASAQRFPTVDLSVSSFQTISRAFSNDPQNINERSRARQRTDATLNISQPVFDFGATSNRISSARSRLVASQAEIDATSDRIALGVVGAWYDVFAFRSMKALSESFVVSQEELRGAVKTRIAQGVSAAGDIAQVDSYIGSAKRRVAEFERERASAEARYFELVGEEAPANLSRIAGVVSASMSKDMAQYAARSTATVASAEAVAEASRRDARAARAALLPNLSVGVDAGRYGVFETQRDYDIRARITLRQRFFGGTEQNADKAIARSHAATARADRIREESARDASIAWSDVKALEEELSAVEASYVASRRSRDVLVERFKVSRGTLFDVLGAEDNLFQSAASYVRTMTQLDTARFVLLSRTGKLMTALELPSAQGLTTGRVSR